MICPFCSHLETKVLESRIAENSLRRRRECLNCGNRFTTYEKAVFNLTVLKKDGSIQPFDIQKVARSIEKACGKVGSETIPLLTKNVEGKILRKKINQIKTVEVGRLVMQELKRFDKIAYLRFTSIYKKINDPKLLKKEISLIT